MVHSKDYKLRYLTRKCQLQQVILWAATGKRIGVYIGRNLTLDEMINRSLPCAIAMLHSH